MITTLFTPSLLAGVFGIGGPELMLILFIALLLFGGKRMPELARGLGQSIREFKKASAHLEDEFKRNVMDEPAAPTRTRPVVREEQVAAAAPVAEKQTDATAPRA